MVSISTASHRQDRKFPKGTFQGLALFMVLGLSYLFFSSSPSLSSSSLSVEEQPSLDGGSTLSSSTLSSSSVCQYSKLSDLTPEEWKPTKGKRHMIQPPLGGKMALVCCDTTVGPLNIAVHHKWAPKGAQRFMEMVTSGYLGNHNNEDDVPTPMMRCIKNFLCQFGLSGDANKIQDFKDKLKDDENWLPQGKDFRKNEEGVKRFAQGYFAFAGSGKDSRSKQLFVALTDLEGLAESAPWEVPWGELVGQESYETLAKFHTGYGDHGPSQGRLQQVGMTEEMKQEFPELSYLKSCQVLDERVQDTR